MAPVTRCALPPPLSTEKRFSSARACLPPAGRAAGGTLGRFPWNGQRPLVGTSSIMALVLWKGPDLTVPGRCPILALEDGCLKAPPGTACSWTQRGAGERHHAAPFCYSRLDPRAPAWAQPVLSAQDNQPPPQR